MNKLLIVDDEQIERDALKYVIERHCSRVQVVDVAANGREALEKAKRHKPDIIFMDIKMPGINGLEAAKQIKQIHEDCKIVFLSAFNYFEYAQKAVEVGAVDFILKPVSNEQVLAVIDKASAMLEHERGKKSKEEEIMKKFNAAVKYLEHELLMSLVHGGMEQSQLQEYVSMMDIRFGFGFAVIFDIRLPAGRPEYTSAFKRDLTRLRVMDKFKQYVQSVFSECLLIDSKKRFYGLIGHDGQTMDDMPDIHDFLLKTSETLSMELGVILHIGIGSMYTEIEDMPLSFNQAKLAFAQASDDRRIIRFEDLRLSDESAPVHEYPLDKEKQLCEKVLKCDEEEASALLDDILDQLAQTSATTEQMKVKVHELTVVIVRAVVQEFKGTDLLGKSYYEMVQAAPTIEAVKTSARMIVADIVEKLGVYRMDKTGSLIEKVCEFIQENYMNEITLEDMAGMINYSTYYFSKMFKYYQGQTFIDYLTGIRINKSKELLHNSLLSIKEISHMVGYADQNYFTRVFKRVEGETPTSYRDKIMLNPGH